MLPKIACHQPAQMQRGVPALADRVGAIGVGHHGERLVVPDEFVDKPFGPLVVAVVVVATRAAPPRGAGLVCDDARRP